MEKRQATRAIVSLQNRLNLNHIEIDSHTNTAIVSLQNRLNLNRTLHTTHNYQAIVSLQNRLNLNDYYRAMKGAASYSFLTKSAKLKRFF